MLLKVPFTSISKEKTLFQPVKVVNLANEHERLQWREKLGEVLSEKTLCVGGDFSKKNYHPSRVLP